MEVAKVLLINFGVPALGVWLYWNISQRMCHSLSRPLLLAFVSYGGWLMVFLTGMFWYWSGMATIGVAYLMFIAPILMLILAYRLWPQRGRSKLHFRLFVAAAAYIIFPMGVLLLWVVMVSKYGP